MKHFIVMKKLLAIVYFLCTVLVAKSQNLTVEGTAPNLYITHTVAPKENFYSIGRLYNQSPKSIASFNSIEMEKGLKIGQRIKIPLNEQNLSSGISSGGESIPLTHIVAKSEPLSKIGADYNVKTETIRQWNSLSSDNITPGTPLVVGHLKMTSTGNVAKAASNPQVNNQPAETKPEAVAVPKQTVAEPKKEEAAVSISQTPVIEKKETTPAVIPETTKPSDNAVSAPVKENSAKETTPQPEMAKDIPVKEAVVKEPVVKAEETKKDKPSEPSKGYDYSSTSSLGSIEGVFAGSFPADASQKSLNTKNGEAATFKSTSGWQDKKYYVLMNDVTPGTILKIASADNKIVYAKVLGSMPEMKENNGLLIRISNSAASYLGIIDPKFPVSISYYQ